MKILLDTSFIIAAIGKKLDIVSELRKFGNPELSVISLVVKEIKKLAEGRGKKAKNARLALSFLEKEDVEVIITGPGHTDGKIITLALNRNMAVCTLDAELKKTLLRRGAKTITIRQGKYLVLVNQLAQTRKR